MFTPQSKSLKKALARQAELEAKLAAAESKLGKARDARQADAAKHADEVAALRKAAKDAAAQAAEAAPVAEAAKAAAQAAALAPAPLPVPRARVAKSQSAVSYDFYTPTAARAATGAGAGAGASTGTGTGTGTAAGAGAGAGAGAAVAKPVPYPIAEGASLTLGVPAACHKRVVQSLELTLSGPSDGANAAGGRGDVVVVHADVLHAKSGKWESIGVARLTREALKGSRARGNVTIPTAPGALLSPAVVRITVTGDTHERWAPATTGNATDVMWLLHNVAVKVGDAPVHTKDVGEVDIVTEDDFPFWKLAALAVVFVCLCAIALVMVFVTGSSGCFCIDPRLVRYPTHLPT